MIKEAIDRVLELKQEPVTLLHGMYYNTKSLSVVTPPRASALELNTLESLVEYVKSVGETSAEHFIQVVNESTVKLMSKMDPLHRDRELLTKVTRTSHGEVFPFGNYLSQETFITKMQSLVVKNEARDQILKFVGSITTEQTNSSVDDGITQTVAAKVGVALVQEVRVPNPVFLRPFRTFLEVPQPESPFILRVRRDRGESPEIALFEADGGKWKLDAITSIAKFLAEKIKLTILA